MPAQVANLITESTEIFRLLKFLVNKEEALSSRSLSASMYS